MKSKIKKSKVCDYIIDWSIAIVLSLFTCLAFNFMGIMRLNANDIKEREYNDGTGIHSLVEGSNISCYSSSFDVYFNFLWIFACIFALSKITELSERYLCERMISIDYRKDVRSINKEWETTMHLYEKDKEQMGTELKQLREKNKGLELMMHELRDCNIQLISENFMRSVLQDQQKKQPPNNIFITNRHIHLTRQVFVNEGHIDVNLQDQEYMTRPASGQENKEINTNVWVQYLKMRKCYMGPIADPNLIVNGGPEKKMPIVMTTEQLSKLQGLI